MTYKKMKSICEVCNKEEPTYEYKGKALCVDCLDIAYANYIKKKKFKEEFDENKEMIVGAAGSVVIPYRIRKIFDINTGDSIYFSVEDDKIFIRKEKKEVKNDKKDTGR